MKDAAEVYLFFSNLDKVLGILGERMETQELTEEAQRLIRERDQARANKDWATADRIRNELLAMGIVVEDTATGSVWKRNRP
jgi:cysteinyl-tRNA synthetase